MYLNHDSSDALQAHHHHRVGTLLSGVPGAVADGVLRLYAEQEAGGEPPHVHHTRGPPVERQCHVFFLRDFIFKKTLFKKLQY